MSTAPAATGSGGRATAARPRAARYLRPWWRGRTAVALAFLLPSLVALTLLRLLPGASAVWGSLHHTSLLSGEAFVGLANYADLFANADFRNALGVTLLFTLVVNPLQVAVSVGLAVLYTRRRMAGGKVWRALVILPVATPPAVSAVIWSVIFRPEGGLANALLAAVGLPPQGYLTSPDQALASIIVLLSWIGVGYWMLFLIAGINDIPAELYEAAELDGASPLRAFLHVTLPMLRRPLSFVLVAATVSNLLVFAPVQILTGGGPEGSTNLLMFDIYNRAYALGDMGRAQAEVVVLVAVTIVIVAVQFRMLRSED
ncbi:carbohydrate ABC transporter permease [Nocardiopsis flavescens]|uniref:Multiple sugar transport system permease protein n=1 Tax=Nocardiopsis flavescens TaxID=758803 RepID=A0A1M6JG94_9ACTN|nr:sugar ABC transporter permease [Nocardiopsis flavescens]SHJ45711.1 multiple sugar transport system permease protein [Nocardiopsis flavescens]